MGSVIRAPHRGVGDRLPPLARAGSRDNPTKTTEPPKSDIGTSRHLARPHRPGSRGFLALKQERGYNVVASRCLLARRQVAPLRLIDVANRLRKSAIPVEPLALVDYSHGHNASVARKSSGRSASTSSPESHRTSARRSLPQWRALVATALRCAKRCLGHLRDIEGRRRAQVVEPRGAREVGRGVT